MTIVVHPVLGALREIAVELREPDAVLTVFCFHGRLPEILSGDSRFGFALDAGGRVLKAPSEIRDLVGGRAAHEWRLAGETTLGTMQRWSAKYDCGRDRPG